MIKREKNKINKINRINKLTENDINNIIESDDDIVISNTDDDDIIISNTDDEIVFNEENDINIIGGDDEAEDEENDINIIDGIDGEEDEESESEDDENDIDSGKEEEESDKTDSEVNSEEETKSKSSLKEKNLLDDEDDEEDSPAKKEKKEKNSSTPKEPEIKTPAYEFAKTHDLVTGQSRYFNEKFDVTSNQEINRSNKQESIDSFIECLEDNGLSYIFDGVKTTKGRRTIAQEIQRALEQAVINTIFVKGMSYTFMNSKFDGKPIKARVHRPVANSPMTKYSLKLAHHIVTFSDEFHRGVGMIYSPKGKSELSLQVEPTGDGYYKVIGENIFCEKGTILDENGRRKKTTAKKIIKKK